LDRRGEVAPGKKGYLRIPTMTTTRSDG
jgi:hypothetical protein